MNALRRVPSTIWQLLLVTLLGLPLITPLLRWTVVACTHDGHLHVHRIAAMKHAWGNGIYFTRWLPDLAFGYGYPFFVYREPTPLYAALAPHLMGLPLPAASNLFYALCVLAAGWFMFLWVRDVLGWRAGLVASVAYMAAPYVLLDALVRGNAPESLALPLLPLLLWQGRRWMVGGTAVAFLVGVLSLAFLSLSHNISVLIFVPTLLVYLLVVGWIHRVRWLPLLGRAVLLLGLGLGMTIFYTGGALLEMDQVTLQQSTTTRNNDFRFNFAGWREILAPVAPEDPQLINPPLPIRLGWVPVALAVIGATSLLWRRDLRRRRDGADQAGRAADLRAPTTPHEQRWHIGLMVAGTAVYLFMSLQVSQPIWEALPLIDFVQFPWRFIGRAALPVAFLAGAPWAASRGGRSPSLPARAALFIALALLILEAIPNLYPRYCAETPFPTINDVHSYERITGLVGVDPEGSYFPRTVQRRPTGSPLEADYAAGRTPQRLDWSDLPAGGAVNDVEYGRLSARAQVDSPAPFTMRYLSFVFPGWVARVDGEPVPITPSDPEGLITFPVPAGAHTVSVSWQSTPLRTALSTASLLALLAALLLVVFRRRVPLFGSPQPAREGWSPDRELGLLLLLALALLGVKLLVDTVPTSLRRTAPPPVDQTVVLQAGELRLAGFSLSDAEVVAGETFDIDLAWSAAANPTAEYQSNVWLEGPDGLLWSDKETYRPRIYEDAPPTLEWEAGQWAWDSREVEVLSGTPPGTYNIVLTVFDLATLQPLTLLDADGAAVGPTAVIGQMTVELPPQPVALAPQYPLDAPLTGTDLRLLGYNQDRETAVPGEELLLTLFWERTGTAVPEELPLTLRDAAGTAVHVWKLPSVGPEFHADTWPVGQRLRAQYFLRLPAALESGRYQFVLGDDLALGEVEVMAPERVFAAPGMETAVGASFDDEVELAGYTLSTRESSLTVELVWQAMSELATSYRVFVHLIDAAGSIVAQSDGEPAAWTRPTTGWIPGEYVTDAHTITLPDALPEGSLSLRVGLYDPDSGARLPLAAEPDQDAVVLPLR